MTTNCLLLSRIAGQIKDVGKRKIAIAIAIAIDIDIDIDIDVDVDVDNVNVLGMVFCGV